MSGKNPHQRARRGSVAQVVRTAAAGAAAGAATLFSAPTDRRKKPSGKLVVAGQKVQLPPLIFNPHARWKTAWDLWMAILILYSVIFVPVRVGFAWRSCIFAPDWIWDLFVDGCFVMDILITFRTAIFIDGGEKNQQFVITDPKSIAVRYAKSWLIIDVSSTIPVNVIVDLVMYASSSAEDAAVMRTCAYLDAPSSNTDVSSSLKSVQSLRVIRVVRLLKLFRFLKLGQLLRRWEDQANLNPAIFRLTRLFVVILFLSHLIACMWFGVFKLVIPEGEERTRSNWVAAYAANQMTDAASERVLTDSLTQYLSAMYWAFTTMTTVGYGDILPQNLLEMWFVILMEFVGLIVFGMAIASMTNILANFNLQKKLLRERMAVVNRYVRERDLTQRMQRRVRRFYEYYLERVSVFEVATMLDEVSQSLKNDLCEVIFREMANDLPALLAGRDASFVALVGMQLQPFFSLPGEYICRRGVIGLEVYWIRKGRVQLKWGERSTQVGFLGDGDHFGQEVLHSRDLKMISDVRAVLYCDLLYIPKQALEELNNTYPTLIEELKRGSGAHSQPEQPPPERPTQLHLPASMDSAPPSTVSSAASTSAASTSTSTSAASTSAASTSTATASSTPVVPLVPGSLLTPRTDEVASAEAAAEAAAEEAAEAAAEAAAETSVATSEVPAATPSAACTAAAVGHEESIGARPPPVDPPSPGQPRSSRRSRLWTSDKSSPAGGAPSSALRCTVAIHSALHSARKGMAQTPSLTRRSRRERESGESDGDGGKPAGRGNSFGLHRSASEREKRREEQKRRNFERDIKAMALERHGLGVRTLPMKSSSLSSGSSASSSSHSSGGGSGGGGSGDGGSGGGGSGDGVDYTDKSMAVRRDSLQSSRRRGSLSSTTLQWQDHKEEERLERLELSRRGIVHPNSPFRSVWDMGLAMLVIYSIVVVPLRIGFEIESASDSAIFWFEVSIDFTFIIDIVINCRTAYITSDGALESRPRRILRHYALSWFAVDFISSIPIDLILLAVGDVGGDSRNSLRLTKLIKSLRLVRLLKLLRLLKITKYLKTAQEELQVNPLVLELVGLAIKTLFLMHLAACVWHWSALLMLPDLWELRASCNATSCVFDARADAALNTWLQYFADSHFAEGVWPSVVETYTASMYWALTTMSTIGYGDIKSITNLERVVSIIIMLVGSVIFGIVVGGMTNVLEQINSVRARATEKKDYVKAMLRERAIPQVLITRTKQYYNHYLLECADVATEQKILSELCPPLRTEVLLFLNARTVESIHFFHGQDSTFIVSVCKMLKPCFFAPQDWIFREGELGLEMYFMQLGSVEVVCYLNAQEVVLDTLESGAYFGEVAIMIDGVRREASVRAVSFCSMFSFSKESLNYLLQMYPDVMRTMQSQMEQRLRRWRLKRTINTVKCHNRIANAFKLAGRPTPGCASGSDGAGAREERSSAVSDGADAEADSGRRSSHSAREGEAAAGRPTPPRPSKGESKGEPKEAAPAGTPAPAAESDRRDSTPSMRRQKSMLPGSCSFARRSSITPSKSRASSGGADDEAPKSPVIAALNNSNSIEHSLEKLEQARHRGVGLCSAAAAADALGASSPKASHLTPADEPPPSHSAADDGGGAAPSQSRLSELKVEDPDVDGSLDPARASQLWSENAHGKVTFQGGRRMSVEHGGQKLRID